MALGNPELIEELNAPPHTDVLELPSAYCHEFTFELDSEPEGPAHFFIQAILHYEAMSSSGGVLRFSVNDQPLGPERSVNKAESYWTQPKGGYTANAFALPAQPHFGSGNRPDLGGLGYLFDIGGLVHEGSNVIRVRHAAAANSALLRDACVVAGDRIIPLSAGEPAVLRNDPKTLQWGFAPDIQEHRGLFICRNSFHSTYLFIKNDDDAGAVQLGLQLDLPVGIRVENVYLPSPQWSGRIRLQTRSVTHQGEKYTRHIIRLPASASIPAETGDFISFHGYPLRVLMSCDASPGDYTLYHRSLSQGGEGELMQRPVTVLPAIQDSPQPERSLLGMWLYRACADGVTEREKELESQIRAATYDWLAHVGISRAVVSEAKEIPPAHKNTIIASLASFWSFRRTVYPENTTDLDKAQYDAEGEPILVDRRTQTYRWCPTYASKHGSEVFGLITERMQEADGDGFDLDHEGLHYQCFCDRCKSEFLRINGLSADQVTWPDDVLEDGQYHGEWVDFQVLNGNHHVREIREAVKAGDPDATLFSWFVMSLYEQHAVGPHAETYRSRWQEERENGYDLRGFMQYLDYANMANGVYPKDESSWDEAYGLNWAFERVEATVQNPYDVPLAPCLNFGWGNSGTASWTSFRYLRWQAKTHIAQGVQGLDFWKLPFCDGRHWTMLSELSRIFAATENIIWDGERADEEVKVKGPDTIFWRAFQSDEQLMIGITNRGPEEVTVSVEVPDSYTDASFVLSDQACGRRVTVPPLDGIFIVCEATSGQTE